MARDEIPPGTLDMLILKTLADHPALQRMLIKGWITGRWSHTEENRRARFYRLTPTGRKQLLLEVKAYQRVTDAIISLLAYA